MKLYIQLLNVGSTLNCSPRFLRIGSNIFQVSPRGSGNKK
ncbi:hypothetical protein IMCC1989_2060 [gamma proteobacterium IMCC1989]|nr:hypothetical protein IMCC1989_2060 [gamma proteobacterium IMCC1989]